MSVAHAMPAVAEIRVGISDLQCAQGPSVRVITHALGSCVGVFAWHPQTLRGGCLHFKLPATEKPRPEQPFMYANTGLRALFRTLVRNAREARRLRLVACGGAEMAWGPKSCEVGERNVEALRAFLHRHRLTLDAEDFGGSDARTAGIDLTDGGVHVRTASKIYTL